MADELSVPGSGLILPSHIAAPNINIIPEDSVEDQDIRSAMKAVVERRKKNPDFVQKQLDGVIAAKPFISPEHYHISYEYGGFTYPHVAHAYRRARLAYLEMWRLQSLSVRFGEPEFDDDGGTITISTPIKGRTGIHRVTLRAVECYLIECARNPSPLQPLLGAPDDGDIRP